jgi:hypothetical protein
MGRCGPHFCGLVDSHELLQRNFRRHTGPGPFPREKAQMWAPLTKRLAS